MDSSSGLRITKLGKCLHIRLIQWLWSLCQYCVVNVMLNFMKASWKFHEIRPISCKISSRWIDKWQPSVNQYLEHSLLWFHANLHQDKILNGNPRVKQYLQHFLLRFHENLHQDKLLNYKFLNYDKFLNYKFLNDNPSLSCTWSIHNSTQILRSLLKQILFLLLLGFWDGLFLLNLGSQHLILLGGGGYLREAG